MLELKRYSPGLIEDSEGEYYSRADLLPLLREARELIERAHGIVYGHPEPYSSFLNDAQAFLDATAAIEEEKGVEG